MIASKMENSQDYINWLWLEFERILGYNRDSEGRYDDGFCQCESELLINRSDRPDVMRSFLILAVFIDQTIYKHFQQIYNDFREKFYYPKLQSHIDTGMAGPNWFVYSYQGFDKRMNWDTVPPIARALFGDLLAWLKASSIEDSERFKKLMELEIRVEFELESGRKLVRILKQVADR